MAYLSFGPLDPYSQHSASDNARDTAVPFLSGVAQCMPCRLGGRISLVLKLLLCSIGTRLGCILTPCSYGVSTNFPDQRHTQPPQRRRVLVLPPQWRAYQKSPTEQRPPIIKPGRKQGSQHM